MKLYLIVFSTAKPFDAKVFSYVETAIQDKSRHRSADGFPVVKETDNCWLLDRYPPGMPKQYRKANEYKVMNNSGGIYMFGRDPDRLIRSWNAAASA